jgi:SH3-like domain-containing protein
MRDMTRGRTRFWGWLLLGLGALGLALPALAQNKPPYFLSLKSNEARMRAGPGRNYPASWLYKRKGLPVKVVDVYGEWRRIEDPDGTQGWMQANLLDNVRTAMVTGTILEMRAAPTASARVNWRAEPGVVGAISRCASGWCWFDVHGRGGYVEQSHIWGTDPGETVN